MDDVPGPSRLAGRKRSASSACGSRRRVAARAAAPSVLVPALLPLTGALPVGSRAAVPLFSGGPLFDGACPAVCRRPDDCFFPRLSSAMSRENRTRRRLRRRPCLFGVRPPPLVGGRPGRMSRAYVSYLKASYKGRLYLGGPDYTCSYCKAFFWYDKRAVGLSAVTQRRMCYTHCCKGGRVHLDPYRPWPGPLDRLMKFGAGGEPAEFMRLIRSYNSMFAFCSMGVNVDDSVNLGPGPYVFRINGLPSHRIGSLVPAPFKMPKFAQLYIFDTANEIANRMAVLDGSGDAEGGVNREIVAALIEMLNSCNALVKQFRMIRVSRERIELSAAPFSIRIVGSSSDDPNVYSPPSAPELAALIVGDLELVEEGRDQLL